MAGSRTVSTGMKLQEEVRFTWEIDNVAVVMGNDSLVNSQEVEFSSGMRFGEQSKWVAKLGVCNEKGKKLVRLHYALKEKAATLGNNCYSQMFVEVPGPRGIPWKGESEVTPCQVKTSGGASVKFDANELLLKTRGTYVPHSWNIQIILKLFSLKMATGRIGSVYVQPSLEQFHVDARAKVHRDLSVGNLAGVLIAGDINIISSDGVEYSASKTILAARSPVFAAMFRTNMTEAKEGIIKLPDISGETLKVTFNPWVCK